MAKDPKAFARGVAWVSFAYAVALGVAWLVVAWMPWAHPLVAAGAADVAATFVIFGFSFAFRNSSFYDPYWSVAPIPIAFWLAAHPMAEVALPARQVLVLVLVGAWGARLTYNWLRGWQGLHHEDWRYEKLADDTGKAYWLVSLTGIHLFPTVLVFLGCLALWPALVVGRGDLGLVDALAVFVTAGAIVIEGVADNQLRAFVKTNRDPQRIMDTGLWSWSRHPNYFGETSFWWGVWLFGVAADPSIWWTVVGPLAMTGLFVFISIPMMEKRMLAKRPHYAEHQRRVSSLVPLPPKRQARAAS